MTNITMTNRSAAHISPEEKTTSHWFEFFVIVYGLWVWLPWLAPIFMHIGWDGAGRVIYFIYSYFCHQLPERSFFFFGSKTMYSLPVIQSAWQNTFNPLILRQFIGNSQMGWKLAWSDRMVSFYTSIWLSALVWLPLRRRIKPLPWWGFALFLLPIALDGGTHMISDFAGIGQGFRYTNQWLAILTNNSLPATFYAGDALGSFNSLMRLITGLLAGIGIVWFAFPYMEESFGKS
ncbi:MAG: DUF2085 domain-containing protein [Chloroflexi bacterium]|nr:DUF2085 domain-containing protein [Chloroflexota bacterium]